ncbi:unnamed protein product [Aureobasidium uvarum]|uniref:Uncharacterized protein n=1 Tax=Aureobasidium uvarum TaxID=2773716 RepID=A0A9N8PQY4_9PEZI|nr:unnamed protein product [Aureobasidium uvarum]
MDAETWEEVQKLQQLWQREEDMRYGFAQFPWSSVSTSSSSSRQNFVKKKEPIPDVKDSGISAEATLCMQKEGNDWDVYASLPTAIKALQTLYTAPRQLSFLAYFSESDVMIGKGGKQYFEDCWRQGNGRDGEVKFMAKTVPDTDHDSIVLAEKGCVEEVFREVKRLCG